MRLDLELVQRKLSDSRTEAQELIEQGAVFVNGEITKKKTRQVTEQDEITVTARRRFVSRGGEKLEGVLLDMFGDEDGIRRFCEAKSALDVGSSTGGFTDCLLSYGVAHIDAVDVGTEQLHVSLREDARISLFEQTDIRDFIPRGLYDIIVCDLSFIPLGYVLPKISELGNRGALYLLLMKPQFEVGKGGTKKGIVKDQEAVNELLTKYEVLLQDAGAKELQIYLCKIQGGDGNQEYFISFRK